MIVSIFYLPLLKMITFLKMILRYHSVPDWVTILGCEPYSVIIPNLLLSFSNSNNSNNNNSSDILPNLSLIFNLCHFQLTSTRSSTFF